MKRLLDGMTVEAKQYADRLKWWAEMRMVCPRCGHEDWISDDGDSEANALAKLCERVAPVDGKGWGNGG